MDSLNDYARALDSALKWKRAYSAYNRDMVHAKIVVTAAFRGAREKIRLLSHRLDRDLYASQSFIDEANDFVGRRGGQVDILVESDIPEDHPLQVLARQHPRRERWTPILGQVGSQIKVESAVHRMLPD